LQYLILFSIDLTFLHHPENGLLPLEALTKNLSIPLIFTHDLIQSLQAEKLGVLIRSTLLLSQWLLLHSRTSHFFFERRFGGFRFDLNELIVIVRKVDIFVLSIQEFHVNFIFTFVFLLCQLLALLQLLQSLLLHLELELGVGNYVFEPLAEVIVVELAELAKLPSHGFLV